MHSNPTIRFLDAVLVLALAARIHRDDAKVRRVAIYCLARVDPSRRGWIESITRMKSPCLYIEGFIRTIPEHILTMKSEPILRRVPFGAISGK